MICTKCGKELHDQALQCWNCGAEMPNYSAEMKALYQAEEKERLRSETLWRNPQEIPASGRKSIRVYKRTWLGRRLAGWVDENGRTFKSNWPFKPRHLLHWSVDEQGHIYIEAGEHRAFVGWIDETGAVSAQYGRPTSGFFSYPQNTWLFQPPIEFSPSLVFQVKADGTIYHRDQRGSKTIAKVSGAPNLVTVAGLALVLLL